MPAEHVPELTIYDRAREKRRDDFATRLKEADTASRFVCVIAAQEAIGAANMLAQAQLALHCGHAGSARALLLLARDRIDAALKPLSMP